MGRARPSPSGDGPTGAGVGAGRARPSPSGEGPGGGGVSRGRWAVPTGGAGGGGVRETGGSNGTAAVADGGCGAPGGGTARPPQWKMLLRTFIPPVDGPDSRTVIISPVGTDCTW